MAPLAMIVELPPPRVTLVVGLPCEVEVELPMWSRPPPDSLMPARDSSTPLADTRIASAPAPLLRVTFPSRFACVMPDESAVGLLPTAPRSMIAPPEFDSVETDRLLDMALTVTFFPDVGAARLLLLSDAAVTVALALALMFAESASSPSEMLSVSAS